MATTSSVNYSPAALNELISTLNQVQQLATSLKSGFESALQQATQNKAGTAQAAVANVANPAAGQQTRATSSPASASTAGNQLSLFDSLRQMTQTMTAQGTATPAPPPAAVTPGNSSTELLPDLSALLAQMQAAAGSTGTPQQASPTGSSVSIPTFPQVSIAPVNLDAVATAKNDRGVYSNGLTIFAEDPSSHGWKLKNINDPALRQQIDTLSLGRESLLQVLSSPDPHKAVGDIYRSMGTYASVEPYGDKGGISIQIKDHEGFGLKNVTWAPTTTHDTPWSGNDGSSLSKTLKMYGIDMPADTNWSSLQSISANLPGRAASGSFKESPWAELMKYGFQTDPLTGKVVGGGVTAAIDHYQATGEKRSFT